MSPEHENHEHKNLDPQELMIVEQTLARLAAAPPRVDRDRLMFLAGAASGRREPPDSVDLAQREPIGKLTLPARLLWPATSAALAATSLALAIVLVTRPTPDARIVYRDREVPVAGTPQSVAAPPSALAGTPPRALGTAPIATIPADNYVRSREVALRLGLDALGNWSGGGSDGDSPAPTYGSLLESFLPAAQGRSEPRTESSQM